VGDTSQEGSRAAAKSLRSVHAAVVVQAGRTRCRASLFDRVEQTPRLVASVVTPVDPSSSGSAFDGVEAALDQLAEMTGRAFNQGGVLLGPRQPLGDGADLYLLTGLPQPPLPLALVSIGADPGLSELLVTALRRMPARLAQLRVSARADERSLSVAAVESWVRQVRPSVLVLAHDGGDAAEWGTVLDGITAVAEEAELPAFGLVVGPEAYQEQAAQTLGDRLELVGVDPSVHDAASVALAVTNELRDRYEDAVRQALLARQWGSLRVVDLVRAVESSVTFTYRRTGQNTLLVHVDDGLLLVWAHDGQVATSFHAERDLGPGAAELTRLPPERIARWLPKPYPLESLVEWLLNRSLRPLAVLETPDDVLVASAVLREAFLDTAQQLDLRPLADIQLIVVNARIAELPSPLVALALLDSLQPLPAGGLVTLALDDVDLLVAAGALASVQTGYARAVLEHDALIPLAHCVVVSGPGPEGALAVRGELRVDGVGQRFSVPYGSIHLLHLPPTGAIGLSLELEPGFRVGTGEPGARVEFDEAAGLSWARLGLLIDARGRPLVLPEATEPRLARVASWLTDLGWPAR
jgi:hypothetical protein